MILGGLGSSVGLPFFILSSAIPLVQALAARRRKANPYRLFALSNFAALLGYPVVIEPLSFGRTQALAWWVAYGLYGALISALMWRSRGAGADRPQTAPAAENQLRMTAPTPRGRIIWMLLAACASALFLAATNYICQSIARSPFYGFCH
jgi:hypothetical protein